MLEKHIDTITSLVTVMMNDARYIASVSEDNTLSIWDIFDKVLVQRLHPGHSQKIVAVLATCDGNAIITTSDDQNINIIPLTFFTNGGTSTVFDYMNLITLLEDETNIGPHLLERHKQLAKAIYFPERWTVFNFLCFMLHNLDVPFIKQVHDRTNFRLTLDISNNTQFDFLAKYLDINTLEKRVKQKQRLSNYIFNILISLFDTKHQNADHVLMSLSTLR